MKACKHLDYDEAKYPKCQLCILEDFSPPVKYWDRRLGGYITDAMLADYPEMPVRVQFCKRRGRINEIFACYQREMPCYEPIEEARDEAMHDEDERRRA